VIYIITKYRVQKMESIIVKENLYGQVTGIIAPANTIQKCVKKFNCQAMLSFTDHSYAFSINLKTSDLLEFLLEQDEVNKIRLE
jgi:hypothetical protein